MKKLSKETFPVGYVGQQTTKQSIAQKDMDLLKHLEEQIKKLSSFLRWVRTFLDGAQPASNKVMQLTCKAKMPAQ